MTFPKLGSPNSELIKAPDSFKTNVAARTLNASEASQKLAPKLFVQTINMSYVEQPDVRICVFLCAKSVKSLIEDSIFSRPRQKPKNAFSNFTLGSTRNLVLFN